MKTEKFYRNFNLTFILAVTTFLVLASCDNIPASAQTDDDYYTSLIGVQSLAKDEQEIVKRLVKYKTKLEERLRLINEYLDDYSESIRPFVSRHESLWTKYGRKRYPVFRNAADRDVVSEAISANPVMVFKLLRRFAKELPVVAINVLQDIDTDFRDYIGDVPDKIKVPTEHDLNGAADGILRLQETYQLSTRDISNGRLIDKKTGIQLRAADMHLIGIRAHNKKLLATAVEWLYQGWQKSLKGDTSIAAEIVEEHLRTIKDYHNEELLRFTYENENLFPNFINSNLSNVPGLHIPPFVTEYKTRIVSDTIFDKFNFMALCRGEKLLSPQQTKSLRCWYSTESPYNVISPLKYEMHHENPPVYQIYDLIPDSVIKHIRSVAHPNLKRAQVVGDDKKVRGTVSDVRTSSVAWIGDSKNNNMNDTVITKLPSMVQRVTGFDVWTKGSAEDLQVSCYGSVGGFYLPHLDALVHPEMELTLPDDTVTRGDRVATLSDVELGGGTAFPRLGVAATAVKGSAVMWYNLRHNGVRELLMLHGGCPVLYGNKWVANKWIRLYDQFHVRKCTKDRFE